MAVSPGGVLGLKDSPNHIQEPLWIFPQPRTMTFPVIRIRSGKWVIYLDEPSCRQGNTFPGGLLYPG